jgi:hypothetical protein
VSLHVTFRKTPLLFESFCKRLAGDESPWCPVPIHICEAACAIQRELFSSVPSRLLSFEEPLPSFPSLVPFSRGSVPSIPCKVVSSKEPHFSALYRFPRSREELV